MARWSRPDGTTARGTRRDTISTRFWTPREASANRGPSRSMASRSRAAKRQACCWAAASHCWRTTLGTPWEFDTRGAILFLEDRGVKPYHLDRMLVHLHAGGEISRRARHCPGRFSGLRDARRQHGFRARRLPAHSGAIARADRVRRAHRAYHAPDADAADGRARAPARRPAKAGWRFWNPRCERNEHVCGRIDRGEFPGPPKRCALGYEFGPVMRLRRIADRDRIFFVTTNLEPGVAPLTCLSVTSMLKQLARQHDAGCTHWKLTVTLFISLATRPCFFMP